MPIGIPVPERYGEIIVFYDRDLPDMRSATTWPTEAIREAQTARSKHVSLANELDAIVKKHRGCGSGLAFASDPDRPMIFDSLPGLHTWHELAMYATSAGAFSVLLKAGKDILVKMLDNKVRRPSITVRIGSVMVTAHSLEEFKFATDYADAVIAERKATQRKRKRTQRLKPTSGTKTTTKRATATSPRRSAKKADTSSPVRGRAAASRGTARDRRKTSRVRNKRRPQRSGA